MLANCCGGAACIVSTRSSLGGRTPGTASVGCHFRNRRGGIRQAEEQHIGHTLVSWTGMVVGDRRSMHAEQETGRAIHILRSCRLFVFGVNCSYDVQMYA